MNKKQVKISSIKRTLTNLKSLDLGNFFLHHMLTPYFTM